MHQLKLRLHSKAKKRSFLPPLPIGFGAASMASAAAASQAEPISTMWVFGDSSADVGSSGPNRRPTNQGEMWARRMSNFTAIILVTLGLTACSSIIDGTSQTISVNTTPPGALCKVHRNGEVVAEVSPTPAGFKTQKSKHNLNVICEKDGYQKTEFLVKSGFAGTTVASIILGGEIFWAIDSATGAANKYEEILNIVLIPASVPIPAPVPGSAPAALPTFGNKEERLRNLKDLLDRRVITQVEHDQKRQEIQSGI